jgi:hypothetical protein
VQFCSFHESSEKTVLWYFESFSSTEKLLQSREFRRSVDMTGVKSSGIIFNTGGFHFTCIFL